MTYSTLKLDGFIKVNFLGHALLLRGGAVSQEVYTVVLGSHSEPNTTV